MHKLHFRLLLDLLVHVVEDQHGTGARPAGHPFSSLKMENLEKEKLIHCLKWDLNKYINKSLLRSPLLMMVWKVPL